MRQQKFALLLGLPVAAFALLPQAAFAAPKVVASIKPVHSLVAAVMEGVGTPELIVEGAASAHTYNLKPSNARALESADLVVWIGHGMEAFLEKPLESLSGKATVLTLEDAPGLVHLPFREGGTFEPEAEDAHGHGHAEHAEAGDHDDDAHEHEHEHEDHDADPHGNDTHLWLDPMNAKAMTVEIAATLSKIDPDNALTYEKNAKALEASLDQLDAEIAKTVAPVKGKPFIVFHDAYHYFENRYGLSVAGSVTVSPEVMPGAERISIIHDKIASLDAACVFAEPQFSSKLLDVVSEGTSAKSGTLDPLGAALEPGPSLYPQLMRDLASSLTDCLR